MIYIYIYIYTHFAEDIYIYPYFAPRRGHCGSVRKTNERMMYMEIVAVIFENAQKHINTQRGQKCILLSVKTSRIYTNCQGLQQQLFITNIILSKIKWPIKLALNSSISKLIKSVSPYLLITSIWAEGQDGFSRRFAHVQTFVMRHILTLDTSKCFLSFLTFFTTP